MRSSHRLGPEAQLFGMGDAEYRRGARAEQVGRVEPNPSSRPRPWCDRSASTPDRALASPRCRRTRSRIPRNPSPRSSTALGTSGTRESPWGTALRIGPKRWAKAAISVAQLAAAHLDEWSRRFGSNPVLQRVARQRLVVQPDAEAGSASAEMTAGCAVRQRKYQDERMPSSASIAAIASAERGCWSTSWRRIRTGLSARLPPPLDPVLERRRTGSRARGPAPAAAGTPPIAPARRFGTSRGLMPGCLRGHEFSRSAARRLRRHRRSSRPAARASRCPAQLLGRPPDGEPELAGCARAAASR